MPTSLADLAPSIKTALPGPKAAALIAKDEQYISPSYTRAYPLMMESGEGMMVRDVDGNVFLDMAAGIAVNATGHRHPRVVAAMAKGINEHFVHMSGTDFFYPEQIELAERLAKLAGNGADGNTHEMRVFYCNSGAEAAEGCIKLARFATRRTNVISMRGAFHGRTMGALSVGNSKAIHRRYFGPLVAGMHHTPYPDPYRGLRDGQTPEQLAEECLAHLTDVIFRREVEPDQVAAIMVEPVQGEGGYIVPPKNFLPGLREICDKHGILLVVDEVQAGMGRTGKLFAHQHFGVMPDVIACAKGIASGMPLGAIIAKKSLMTWPPGTHASTFGGNPIACRASLATLDLLEEELIDNAKTQGDYLLGKLKQAVGGEACVGDVRGLGLMIAVDIVKDRASRQPDGELCEKIIHAAFERGLLILQCGQSCIRFCPSLILTQAHCDTAVEIFTDALKASV